MHRCILEDDFDPGGLSIGDTTIAKYWPGRYLRVCTQLVDRKNTAVRLTWALETGSEFKDAGRLMPDKYLTLVWRCDKHGISLPRSKPLFNREYATLEEAKAAHKEAVARFS
jgi:hypothetical protein